jgi:hypothetical protein
VAKDDHVTDPFLPTELAYADVDQALDYDLWEHDLAAPPAPALISEEDTGFSPGSPEGAYLVSQVNGERMAAFEDARQRRYDALLQTRVEWHRANREAQRLVQAEEVGNTAPEPTSPLQWSTFLTEEFPPPDWYAGRIMARGQHIALVGDGKAGKSLFAQEWAWRIASGLPFLGDPARPPRRVMYVDQENGWDDIQERLRSLGATVEQLANLIYLSFPAYRPLNTPAGAADLLGDVARHSPDVVFLDTVSRMVDGEENSADTWLGLYNHTLKPLKAQRRSSVRLDHFGKDKEKGARGNSAKNQDVDGVWELNVVERDSGLLALKRTHTRRGIGRGFFRIQRHGEMVADQWKAGGTWHALADEPTAAGRPNTFVGEAVKALARTLDEGGIPANAGRPTVGPWLRERGHHHADAVIRDVIAYRKARAEGAA